MSHTKVKAIIDVASVFVIIVLSFKAINASRLGEWENQVIGGYFLEYAVVFFVPLAILVLTRRSFSDYGIDFKNPGSRME
jgi:hypothetical protein